MGRRPRGPAFDKRVLDERCGFCGALPGTACHKRGNELVETKVHRRRVELAHWREEALRVGVRH